MRQIVIDELSPAERDNLEHYLKRTAIAGPMEGMFWVELPPELLEVAQQGHEKCGPFFFAVDLGKNRLSFELLVRSQSNLHCSCISYATPRQREFLLAFIDTMLAEERVRA